MPTTAKKTSKRTKRTRKAPEVVGHQRYASRKEGPLTSREKRTIREMTEKGATMRQISLRIGRVPSTIWRWQHRDD